MTALDEVRKDIWHDAYSEYKQVKKENPRGKGHPKKGDPELAVVKAAKAKADEIKRICLCPWKGSGTPYGKTAVSY